MNRKPIFDVIRKLLGRGISPTEVARLDAACDEAEARITAPEPLWRLGQLSEHYESGGRGPGTVSSGKHDPGGVSYGTYQLSSRVGRVADFVAHEGSRWAAELSGVPGSDAFSCQWRAIADRDGAAFGDAQHAYIERTHYRPAVSTVAAQCGLDLSSCGQAVRDVVWSVAVQHGGAAKVLLAAIRRADAVYARGAEGYERALIEATYAERTAYVTQLAESASNRGERRILLSMTTGRYPAERTMALAMLPAIKAPLRPEGRLPTSP